MNNQVRYKRPVPRGMVKQKIKMINEIATGEILEFNYGYKQKPGEVGGWKNDPKPVLLVFYDDGSEYIEGLNTNYLSDYYLRKLKRIIAKFPGITIQPKEKKMGMKLYDVVSKTAAYAVKKGYRKYLRKNLRNTYLYVIPDKET